MIIYFTILSFFSPEKNSFINSITFPFPCFPKQFFLSINFYSMFTQTMRNVRRKKNIIDNTIQKLWKIFIFIIIIIIIIIIFNFIGKSLWIFIVLFSCCCWCYFFTFNHYNRYCFYHLYTIKMNWTNGMENHHFIVEKKIFLENKYELKSSSSSSLWFSDDDDDDVRHKCIMIPIKWKNPIKNQWKNGIVLFSYPNLEEWKFKMKIIYQFELPSSSTKVLLNIPIRV